MARKLDYQTYDLRCMVTFFFVMVMRLVTFVTPFCYGYGYAVSHSEL